jgi:hypothetical protein
MARKKTYAQLLDLKRSASKNIQNFSRMKRTLESRHRRFAQKGMTAHEQGVAKLLETVNFNARFEQDMLAQVEAELQAMHPLKTRKVSVSTVKKLMRCGDRERLEVIFRNPEQYMSVKTRLYYGFNVPPVDMSKSPF